MVLLNKLQDTKFAVNEKCCSGTKVIGMSLKTTPETRMPLAHPIVTPLLGVSKSQMSIKYVRISSIKDNSHGMD